MVFGRRKNHEKWIIDFEKEYGIMIVTPQDKIDSYMERLKLIKGKGMPFQEASQWVAIGDQYRKMGSLLYAKKAYQASLDAVEKVDISKETFRHAQEKNEFENAVQVLKNELLEKLKDLDSDS